MYTWEAFSSFWSSMYLFNEKGDNFLKESNKSIKKKYKVYIITKRIKEYIITKRMGSLANIMFLQQRKLRKPSLAKTFVGFLIKRSPNLILWSLNIIIMVVCHHMYDHHQYYHHHHHHAHMSSYIWPEAQSRFMLCSLSHCSAAICTNIHHTLGNIVIIDMIMIIVIVICTNVQWTLFMINDIILIITYHDKYS